MKSVFVLFISFKVPLIIYNLYILSWAIYHLFEIPLSLFMFQDFFFNVDINFLLSFEFLSRFSILAIKIFLLYIHTKHTHIYIMCVCLCVCVFVYLCVYELMWLLGFILRIILGSKSWYHWNVFGVITFVFSVVFLHRIFESPTIGE